MSSDRVVLGAPLSGQAPADVLIVSWTEADLESTLRLMDLTRDARRTLDGKVRSLHVYEPRIAASRSWGSDDAHRSGPLAPMRLTRLEQLAEGDDVQDMTDWWDPTSDLATGLEVEGIDALAHRIITEQEVGWVLHADNGESYWTRGVFARERIADLAARRAHDRSGRRR